MELSADLSEIVSDSTSTSIKEDNRVLQEKLSTYVERLKTTEHKADESKKLMVIQEQKNEARTGGMAQVGDIISDLINTYRNMEYETNTDIKKRMEEIIGDENNPYYKLKISIYRRAISAESESAKDNPFLSMIKEAGFEGEYEEFRNLTHQQIVNKVKQADVEID